VSTFLTSESDSSCLTEPGKKYAHQNKNFFPMNFFFLPSSKIFFLSQNAEFFRNLEIFQKHRFSIDLDLRQFLPTSSGATLEVFFHHTLVGSRWNGLDREKTFLQTSRKMHFSAWKSAFFSRTALTLCAEAHTQNIWSEPQRPYWGACAPKISAPELIWIKS